MNFFGQTNLIRGRENFFAPYDESGFDNKCIVSNTGKYGINLIHKYFLLKRVADLAIPQKGDIVKVIFNIFDMYPNHEYIRV